MRYSLRTEEAYVYSVHGFVPWLSNSAATVPHDDPTMIYTHVLESSAAERRARSTA